MIQFEVGKTYETIHIDTSIIICARSKHFVTFKVIRPGAPDRTLRKKISVCLLTNKESWEYIRTNGLCHVWCNAQDLADSQPEASQHEKPQTCSIPDTTNITPADDTQEDTQNAQPENVKFVVGKTYLCGHSVWGLDWDGYKATHHSYKITITGRKGNYLTIHDELYGETAKRKLFANEKGVEYIRPKGSYGAYRKLVLFADYPTVEPEIPTTLPPDVASTESDTPTQPENAKSLLNADYFAGKSLEEIKMEFCTKTVKQLKTIALLYIIPYYSSMNKSQLIDAIADKIALILECKQHDVVETVSGPDGYCAQDWDNIPSIPLSKPRNIPDMPAHFPSEVAKVKFEAGCVYEGHDNNGNHIDIVITARTAKTLTVENKFSILAFHSVDINVIANVETAICEMKNYAPIHISADRKSTHTVLASTQSETTAQPEALYDDDSYSDFSGDNSSTDMDIPEEHEPDIIPETHDNPGFTVIPHDRMHIEHPEYTVYPDTITDECPYTVIPACDIPAHNPAAAVVPYADARNIRNFFHILAIYIRMWLAINIHKRDIAIPMPGVFPPLSFLPPSRTSLRNQLRRNSTAYGCLLMI